MHPIRPHNRAFPFSIAFGPFGGHGPRLTVARPNGRMITLFVIVCLWGAFPAMASDQSHDGDTIVITAEDIGAMQALKIADVLNNIPGVKAGSASVGIHGSYKVKVYVDGRPINDPTSSHGAVNWDMILPDDVSRIEILRGKGGLVYGQDASGGVILITTKQNRRFTGNIKAYGGNHDTWNVSTTASSSGGKLAVGVSSAYETTKGFKINNDKDRFQVGLKMNYAPAAEKTVAFSMDYLDDERGLSGQAAYPTPHSRKETRNGTYAFQVDVGSFNSKSYYNDGYRHNIDSSRGLDKTLRVSRFGQDIGTSFTPWDRGDLNCGAAFTWDRAAGTAFEDQAEHSAALFCSQAMGFPKYHMTLTVGIRGNYNSDFDNAVNPEIKLTCKKSTWRLTTAYSRANNTPSFHQRYNETSSTQPNPGLKMETADNFSLAMFATPHASFSYSLSGFYNLLTDRITYVTGDNGIGQYQNFGDVRYAGGDVGFSWKLHATLKAKGSYTYLAAENRDTGYRLPGKTRHKAYLDLYWQPVRPFSMVVGTQYTSRVYRDKNNTKTVPEYTLSDLRVEYDFNRFSLFCEIKNIFDKTYFYADGLLAPPQTWKIGINWRL